MRGRHLSRWLSLGLLALAALVLAGSAMASAEASTRPIATYGPAREWGGTQIRSLDPTPSLPVPSGAPAMQAHIASTPGDQVLSNEFTFSQWAYVARAAKIYTSPSPWSRAIARLQWYTEDGFPSIYLVLRAHWDTRGREWVLLRIPGRPNGRTGWVLRGALGNFHITHQLLVVNRRNMRMYFYYNGRRIWSAPVGIGKPSTPTPAGHFWIDERFALPASNPYYPFAFGTTDFSTLTDWPGGGVVGIHGPYGASWSQIPGRISHGCIRLHVPSDFWLARHLHLGTPLWVQ